jgi:hypothetical protein
MKVKTPLVLIILINIKLLASIPIPIFPSEINCEENPQNISNYPVIRSFQNGYIAVAWQDSTNKLVFQIYDSQGVKQGSNTIVGDNSNINRRFIKAHVGNRLLTLSAFLGNITARIYQLNGNIVNTFTVNSDSPPFFDTIDSTQLDNNRYVILWTTDAFSIYYKVYATNDSPLTTSMLVLDSSTQKYAPAIKPASNNGFIICWIQTDLINDIILCRLFDTNVGLLGSNITVATYASYSRDTRALSIERLLDGNYVIAYNTYSTYFNTFYAILSSNGSVLVTPKTIHVQDGNDGRSPDIASLLNGGFVIVYYGKSCPLCYNNIYLQTFNSSYNPIGNVNILNVDNLTDKNDPSVIGLIDGNYASAWASHNQYSSNSGYDIYFNIFKDVSIQCKDISVYIKTEDTINIDFGSNITDLNISTVNIIFNSLPQDGQLLLNNNGNTVPINTPITYNLISYQSNSNSGEIGLPYKVISSNGSEADCYLHINICYSTCETCEQIGTNSDHQCLTCRNDYLKINSSCFPLCPSSFEGSSYFYDESTNSCKNCISPCNECLSETSCISCTDGYILLEGVSINNCVTSCPIGYWQSGSICKKCDTLCASCLTSSTDCPSCISTAFYLPKNKCVAECEIGYVFNNQNTCISCKSQNLYYSDGKCTTQCPSDQSLDDNNICLCPNFKYNGICYDYCPPGTVSDTFKKICYDCGTIGKYYYNGLCVDSFVQSSSMETNCPSDENCDDSKLIINCNI